MEPILHGRIISVSKFDEFFYVKCKNGEIRYPNVEFRNEDYIYDN